MTRARPSTDALTQLPSMMRPPSRPPSDTGSSHSLSRDRSLSRSLSARVPSASDMRRSRSKSSDPMGKSTERYTQERAVVRAPSGKDLFKDRQMTFARRTSSILKRDGQSVGLGRSQSQAKIGLLGRKTSDPKARRNSEGEVWSEPKAENQKVRVKVSRVLLSLQHLPSLVSLDDRDNMSLLRQSERSLPALSDRYISPRPRIARGSHAIIRQVHLALQRHQWRGGSAE